MYGGRNEFIFRGANWVRKYVLVALSLILLLMAACSQGSSGTGGTNRTNQESSNGEGQGETAEQPRETISLSVSYSSVPDITDVFSLVTWDNLRAEGYDIQPKFMATGELAAQAVAKGDAQLGAMSANVALQAIEQGLSVTIVSENVGNQWALAAVTDVQSISDLNGKRLGVHSQTSVTNALAEYVIKENQISPQVVFVPGSPNRAAALLQGQLDATLLEMADVLALQREAPDKVHLLASYTELMPNLDNIYWTVQNRFLQERPDVVEDLIRGYLVTIRQAYEDPSYIIDRGYKYYTNIEPEVFEEAIHTYLENNIVSPNGGIPEEDAQFTLQFFAEGIGIDASTADIGKYYDLEPLGRVLDEIGTYEP